METNLHVISVLALEIPTYFLQVFFFPTVWNFVDDERTNPVDFRSQGQRSTFALCLCNLLDSNRDVHSLIRLLSMKPCGHDTDYNSCTITFVVEGRFWQYFVHLLWKSMCKLLMMRGGTLWFWVMGSKVKVNFGHLRGDATLCDALVFLC